MKQQSLKELAALLKQHGVRHKAWIKGPKTIEDLLIEIQNEEVVLKFAEVKGKTRIVRYATRVQIDIRRRHRRGLQVLVEGSQAYANGYVRERCWDARKGAAWYRSISEKMRKGKTLADEAARAFCEELGICDLPFETLIQCRTIVEDFRPSKSYPGLYDKYTNYRFFTLLPEDHWREKYIERHEQGRVTEFTWEFV